MLNMPPRLQRLTHSLADGEAIIASLQEPAQVSAMIAAADKGLPSVVGVSRALLDRFGSRIRETIYKQYSGMAVRWIIEQHGFQVLDQGVKISGDPVYASGTRYVRRATTSASAQSSTTDEKRTDIIERFVSVLNVAELHQLVRAAQTQLSRGC
jgi:hypothetical protein